MAKIDVFLPNLAGGGAERSILATATALTETDSVRLLLAAAKGNYLDQVPAQLPMIDLEASKVLAAIPALRRQIRSGLRNWLIRVFVYNDCSGPAQVPKIRTTVM